MSINQVQNAGFNFVRIEFLLGNSSPPKRLIYEVLFVVCKEAKTMGIN